MHRSPPPRGRARRLLLAIALLVSVGVGAPGAAAAQTEPPTTLPETLVGLDPLSLHVPADATGRIDIVIVDADDQQARWWFERDAVVDGLLTVDLAAPQEGVQPVNGPATITVSSGDTTLVTGTVTIDMDPPTPTLTARPGATDAVLSWAPVAGPGTVRYRLERHATDETWSVLVEGHDVGYTDSDLDAGHHRYRLTAIVAGAGEEHNESLPSFATVRIAASRPVPEPSPSNAQAEKPSVRKPVAAEAPERRRPRAVAAAGDISASFTPLREPRHDKRATQVAAAPAMNRLRAVTRRPDGPEAPRLADAERPPARAAAPTVAPRPTPAPAPLALPPAGTLAVNGAGAPPAHPALVALAIALLVLMIGAQTTVVSALRKRT